MKNHADYEKLCTENVTADNIFKKSSILDGAAEEIACDEYYGDHAMIYALAKQLYEYFDKDLDKAAKFYESSSEWDREYEIYGIIDAIDWLKDLSING